jgi:hypothetical protein
VREQRASIPLHKRDGFLFIYFDLSIEGCVCVTTFGIAVKQYNRISIVNGFIYFCVCLYIDFCKVEQFLR